MKQRIGYRALGSFPVQKDENGNRICNNCGKIIIKKRQRKYCDIDCYIEFEQKNYHSALRFKLMAKSKFTCQKCGEQPESKNDLILDHIKPIAIGGDEFDENNLQILCIPCNKIKTKNDARIIANHRRQEKKLRYDIEIYPVKFPRQDKLNL